MSARAPVLMIGLDAAELTLIRKWMEEGALPNLRALRDRGAFGPLASTAKWLVGSPWPSFYTGMPPSEHGLYHYLVWRPERMRHERPSPRWMPLQPFWRTIAGSRRVVAVDIPLTYAPGSSPAREVSGWATHETLEEPASSPPELLASIQARFGRSPFGNEEAHLMTADRLLEIRERCVQATGQVAELGVSLMREDPWDLFMICFAAPHRGGHQLWDSSNLAGEAVAGQAESLSHALKDIYVACDAAVGRLVAEAGEAATTLVFSLHGMGANTSRSELVSEMLARVLADGKSPAPASTTPRLALGARKLLPASLRSWVKSRLPIAAQDWLTLFWRSGNARRRPERAFTALSDLDGYVRINLRGREAGGVVEPGAEYDALCAQICEGLRTFVDADSGLPVVEDIARIADLYPEGRMSRHLPDLMVRWHETPAAQHRRLVSARFGEIAWPMPGRHPQGRSGNHRHEGFLFASGPGIDAGGSLAGASILDLAPTAHTLLGLPVPGHMHGRPLNLHAELPRGLP